MMVFACDFLIILKSASRSGQKASKTIGYSDGCANVRIHGAKQGTAGGCLIYHWDPIEIPLESHWNPIGMISEDLLPASTDPIGFLWLPFDSQASNYFLKQNLVQSP